MRPRDRSRQRYVLHGRPGRVHAARRASTMDAKLRNGWGKTSSFSKHEEIIPQIPLSLRTSFRSSLRSFDRVIVVPRMQPLDLGGTTGIMPGSSTLPSLIAFLSANHKHLKPSDASWSLPGDNARTIETRKTHPCGPLAKRSPVNPDFDDRPGDHKNVRPSNPAWHSYSRACFSVLRPNIRNEAISNAFLLLTVTGVGTLMTVSEKTKDT
jgi:hypothetical protein